MTQARPFSWTRAGSAGAADTGAPARLRAAAETAAAALPALMLSAERLAMALQPGAHGLRRAGQGEDFWQYRAAAPGDSMRQIDWRRSARSDATFVRERELHTAQSAILWVSGAAGMDWTGDPARPTKRARAELIALALALVLLRGGEKVALSGELPQAGRGQADRIAHDLLGRTGPAPAADTPPGTDLRPLRRVVLIGDFLSDPAPVAAYLSAAAAQGVGGAVLQVLDPDEESFPYSGAVRFHAPGAGAARHDTRNADALRALYLDRLDAQRQALSRAANAAGWRFGTHDTGAAPGQALMWLHGALAR